MDNNNSCGVAKAIDGLQGKYRVALDNLIHTPYLMGGKSADEVFAIMTDAGISTSASAITRHRRKACSCARKEN